MKTLIAYFLLVSVCLAQPAPPIPEDRECYQWGVMHPYEPWDGKTKTLHIVIDYSFESKLIERELTRDWTKFAKGSELQRFRGMALGCRMSTIREYFRMKIHIVHKRDTQYRGECPAYQIERGKCIPFDKRAFLTTTYPLLTVEYVINQYYQDSDLLVWKDAIVAINNKYKENLTDVLYAWVAVKKDRYTEPPIPVTYPIFPAKPIHRPPWEPRLRGAFKVHDGDEFEQIRLFW
jgi:hypothetical protein